jgi:hypothetical protein
MADAAKADLIERCRQLMGMPRPNADVLVALSCAWDMGYRTPESLADMAKNMLLRRPRGPQ